MKENAHIIYIYNTSPPFPRIQLALTTYLLWRLFNYVFSNFYIGRWLQKSGRVSLAWRGPRSVGGGGWLLQPFYILFAHYLSVVICGPAFLDPTPT